MRKTRPDYAFSFETIGDESCKIRLCGQRIFSIGALIRLVKKRTTRPVSSADRIVPSRVPTILPPKKISDKRMAKMTHDTSKPIFTLPNSCPVVSEIAFTNASPEFIITLPITDNATPKPRITTPISTISRRTV